MRSKTWNYKVWEDMGDHHSPVASGTMDANTKQWVKACLREKHGTHVEISVWTE